MDETPAQNHRETMQRQTDNQPTADRELWVSPGQVPEYLPRRADGRRVSARTVWRMMQRGDLDYCRDASGRRIVALSAIRQMIARRNADRPTVPDLADHAEHRQRRIDAAAGRLALL